MGEIGREALPGSSREGRIRFCCRHREELSVFSALLSPCLSLLLPPSLPSREVQAAGAAAAGRAAGSGQRWSPSFCPFFHPFWAFVAAPTSSAAWREPGGASDSRQVQKLGRGLQGGHVSSGEEEHPAHHGKRPRPAAVLCGLGVVANRVQTRGGTAGAPPEASCVAASGAGPVSPRPPPPPLGTMRGSPAWQGGAGGSGPSPCGRAAPSLCGMCREDGVAGRTWS